MKIMLSLKMALLMKIALLLKTAAQTSACEGLCGVWIAEAVDC